MHFYLEPLGLRVPGHPSSLWNRKVLCTRVLWGSGGRPRPWTDPLSPVSVPPPPCSQNEGQEQQTAQRRGHGAMAAFPATPSGPAAVEGAGRETPGCHRQPTRPALHPHLPAADRGRPGSVGRDGGCPWGRPPAKRGISATPAGKDISLRPPGIWVEILVAVR